MCKSSWQNWTKCVSWSVLAQPNCIKPKLTKRQREACTVLISTCQKSTSAVGASSAHRCTLALLNKPQRQSSEKPQQVKCRHGLRSQRCQCRFCDLVCHALAHVLVLLRETFDILASRIQVAGQTKAGAIELSDDILRLVVIDGDEVCSPQQWKSRHVLAERFHDGLDVGQELLLSLGVLLSIRLVDGRHSLTAYTSKVLVMLDPEELLADHHEARLTLFDAGQESLIHHLAACLPATFIVLACANGLPLSRLICAAVDAKLHEFGHGVLLHMAVVRLCQNEHVVVCCRLFPVSAAVLSGLELDDPNALTSRASVLLHDARLEGDGLRETSLHVLGAVITEGVRQAKRHFLDAAQSILGAHALHPM